MPIVNAVDLEVVDGLVYARVPVDEYVRMLEDAEWLSCLEAAGVEDWEGVHAAQEIFDQRKEEQN